ncbi:SLC13 family permease [Nocardiopsis mangrovi]|uniref:SLC13 family permease n=1 Tax=Nocardiopsis mangrovi TaxID=1179818 RepID=A0ABV9DVI2_9ACTN
MSLETIGIVGLVVVFLLGTIRPVNMGALALTATFIVGAFVARLPVEDLFGGFPVSLMMILVGVTFLFGFAKQNGTVQWIVHAAVSLVHGKTLLIPWIVFAISTLLAAFGAASPAAVAIIAPIGMTLAVQNRMSPVMMGLMAVNGAAAGSFSPVGILGGIMLSAASHNDIALDAGVLFAGTFAFNVLIAIVTVLIFRRHGIVTDAEGGVEDAPRERLTLERAVTLGAIGLMVVLVAGFKLDAALTCIAIATLLSLVFPRTGRTAPGAIAWTIVLLVCGIVTYVSLLQALGIVDSVGAAVSTMSAPLVAALVICLVGAVVSAFASTTGILSALVPLSIPFLATGSVSTTGLLVALAVSSSVVDASPLSTNGALVVANSPEDQRARVYRTLLVWGGAMTLVVPPPVLAPVRDPSLAVIEKGNSHD